MDATVNDELTFLDYENTEGDTGLEIAATTDDEAHNAIAFRKGSDSLVKAVDKALVTLRKDGTLAEDLGEVLRRRRLPVTPGTHMDWELIRSSLGPLVRGALLGHDPAGAGVVRARAWRWRSVVALMRLSRVRVVSAIARAYVSVIRGTPLLVQLFVIFYGLPSIGRDDQTLAERDHRLLAQRRRVRRRGDPGRDPVGAQGPVGGGAHDRHVDRASTLRRIILPQAARVSVPPLSNTFISLVKDTSLASLILVTELFREAQQIAAFSQEFMVLYVEAAVGLLGDLPVPVGRAVRAREEAGPLCRPLTPRCRRLAAPSPTVTRC